ncbi:phage tail terminator protein [Pantoea dispersa]|uniref:phage tail terminator protein n=1 Tax=Pantoea dispersa TaxID=59814 RepID=UPI003015C4CD
MKLSPIIGALRNRCPFFELNIGGAAEFKNLPETGKMKLPAAYVIPTEDSPAEQKSQTDYWQVIKEGFAVVVVLDNTRDLRGQAASYDAVDDVKHMLWKALLGMRPDDDSDIVEYAGGQLLDMDRGRLYYQFEFTCDREITSEMTRQQEELDELDEFTEIDVDVDLIGKDQKPDGIIEHKLRVNLSE